MDELNLNVSFSFSVEARQFLDQIHVPLFGASSCPNPFRARVALAAESASMVRGVIVNPFSVIASERIS